MSSLLDTDSNGDDMVSEPDIWKQAFVSLIERYPEPVFVINDEAEITGWNDKIAQVLGYSKDDVLGKNAYEVFGTEGEDETLAETVLRSGEPVRETAIRTAETVDGDPFHSRALAVPIHDSDGDVMAVVEVISSVTSLIESKRRMEEIQKEVSGNVEATASELRMVSEQTETTVKEVTALSEQQATQLESVEQRVSTFAGTVEEIATSTDEVNRQVETAANLTADSREAAETAENAMAEVSNASDLVAENGHELRQRTEELDQIIQVVRDIAEQTNMLALNANIEAARAGKKGEGFAVVAEEVKSLAEDSQREVSEIERIAEGIRENITETLESVEETNAEVEAAMTAVDELIENQDEIADTVREVAETMDETTRATDGQASTAEEISSLLDETVSRMERISEEMDDVSEHSEQQARLAREMFEIVERLEADIN